MDAMAMVRGMGAARDELWARLAGLPENQTGEIVDGQLIVTPRPGGRHLRASTRIAGELDRAVGGLSGPAGWIILAEPELHLGEDALVPDVAGWRTTRMPTVPDVATFALVPDWICEVLSPSTARLDRAQKLLRYAEHGVEYAWLVDPRELTLEVYERHSAAWLLTAVHEGPARVRAKPFAEIELDLARWWVEEPPVG